MLVIKVMIVNDLPAGFFKERIASLVVDPSKASVFVVATTGAIGDWAAYIGWPKIEDICPDKVTDEVSYYARNNNNPDGVRNYGDKLSQREAREVFADYPALLEKWYRH